MRDQGAGMMVRIFKPTLVLACAGILSTSGAYAIRSQITSAEDAAMLAACGYENGGGQLTGSPFRRDKKSDEKVVKDSWKWSGNNTRVTSLGFDSNRHKDEPYTGNALCERYVIMRLAERGDRNLAKQRCESIRSKLHEDYNQTRSGSSFTTLSALRAGELQRKDESYATPCTDPDDEDMFACAYDDFATQIMDTGEQRRAAQEIQGFCTAQGADMRSRMNGNDSERRAEAGIDIHGGSNCGRGNGPIIIQQKEGIVRTLANWSLGVGKLAGPLFVMWDANRRQNQSFRHMASLNAGLGYPTQMGAAYPYGGYGMGGSCGMGYGMMGSPCGYGYGYGNGGVIVGGGGYGGGVCGVPPYAPWASMYGGGCGGGGIGINVGVGYGSGMGVGGIPWGMPGGSLGGGMGGIGMMPGMGMPGGMGGYGMMMPGMGGMGYGAMGAPYGMYGAGGGMGGLPGPYGTLNGNNGWGGGGGYGGYGGMYGPGGMYGGAAFGGGASPFNANAISAQAQMYAQYAAQMAKQAQQSSQYAKIYNNQLKDLQQVQDKTYQSYMAYMQASSGLGGNLGGFSGGGSFYGAGYGGGGYMPMSYYPPYSSSYGLMGGMPPATGSGLSLGFSGSYIR